MAWLQRWAESDPAHPDLRDIDLSDQVDTSPAPVIHVDPPLDYTDIWAD